ncbi:hypothetical protein ACEPAG_3917 [Sanghuangporus baumii]
MSSAVVYKAENEKPIPHNSRQYQNYPGAAYILPADDEEIERLHFQHKLMKSIFNEKIFFLPFEHDSGCFVLDSGCGCGAWMSDVASQLSPSTIIHGIDIEARLFPLTRHPSLSFSVTSITALPQKWTNRFDYINQRFLIAALKRAEWSLALDQMSRVLVSGGWVQITEVGIPVAGPVTEKHVALLDALFRRRDMILRISDELPSLLERANFANIRVEKSCVPLGAWAGQIGKDARDNFIGAFRGMKTPILLAGGLGYVNTEQDYDEHIDAMKKEWDETRGAELELFTFCAQMNK